VRIKTFHGDPRRYTEWKREVAATQTLYQIKDEQLAGLVYLALAPGEGKPRDLMAHIEVADLCTTQGLKGMLQILDREYKRDPHVQADDAQARYERCRRAPNQTMVEYLRELRLAKRLLEREDPGTTISDVSFARKMLTKSGLTPVERRGVLASAGAVWDVVRIENALKLLYVDAHKDDRRRVGEMKQTPRRRFNGIKVSQRKTTNRVFFEDDEDNGEWP
jgi:hypothetical protein